MCSPTGLASGAAPEAPHPLLLLLPGGGGGASGNSTAAPAAAAAEGDVCVSSADCPAHMDCDTFSQALCLPRCDKATGADT
jgi:hypothetical protein